MNNFKNFTFNAMKDAITKEKVYVPEGETLTPEDTGILYGFKNMGDIKKYRISHRRELNILIGLGLDSDLKHLTLSKNFNNIAVVGSNPDSISNVVKVIKESVKYKYDKIEFVQLENKNEEYIYSDRVETIESISKEVERRINLLENFGSVDVFDLYDVTGLELSKVFVFIDDVDSNIDLTNTDLLSVMSESRKVGMHYIFTKNECLDKEKFSFFLEEFEYWVYTGGEIAFLEYFEYWMPDYKGIDPLPIKVTDLENKIQGETQPNHRKILLLRKDFDLDFGICLIPKL